MSHNLELILESKNTYELGTNVSNFVYSAVIKLFETLEGKQIIAGNGHHDAQRLALLAKYLIAKKSLLPGKDKKITEGIKELFESMMI